MTKKQELCLQCMKCCKSVKIHTAYTDQDADAIYFFKVRGFKVSFMEHNNQTILMVEADYPCPHLSENGCGIYATRPNACRVFDGEAELGTECAWSTLK